MISTIYHAILWEPIFNAFVWVYTLLPFRDAGVAIVLVTLIIQVVLLPLRVLTKKNQERMSALQPKIKEIEERHRNNSEAKGRAMMELYREFKVNPFSGCLLVLVQIPILFAIFDVFRKGFETDQLNRLYSFVSKPEVLNPIGFGLINLSEPNIYIGVLGAAIQFLQMKIGMPALPAISKTPSSSDIPHLMQKQMVYIIPIVVLISSFQLISALMVYWTISNIFNIIQDGIVWFRKRKNR